MLRFILWSSYSSIVLTFLLDSMFNILLYLTYLYYSLARWSKWLTAQFLVQLYLAQPKVMRSIEDFRSLTTSGAISQSTRCQVFTIVVYLRQSTVNLSLLALND